MPDLAPADHAITYDDVADGRYVVPPACTSDGSGIKQLMPRYNQSMSEGGPEQPKFEIGPARQRAPRRTGGRRAQLTVPDGMWSEIEEIAVQAGTTPNDVLVQLAAERLRERTRRSELEARAERRWQAFRDATPAPQVAAEPLSETELVALSRTMREDA
jgi:hypothetical protein